MLEIKYFCCDCFIQFDFYLILTEIFMKSSYTVISEVLR